MRQRLSNRNTGGGIVNQFAAQKKKTIIASCLIAVMAIMWVRVLGGKKGPKGVDAALLAAAAMQNTSGTEPHVKRSYIELPIIEGRNDLLTRDFFASNDWHDFANKNGKVHVNVVPKDDGEELKRFIEERLKLQAVVPGENPAAYINDKLLSVGEKLILRERGETYECEVTLINQNTVYIRCENAEIELKLGKTISTD